MEEEKNRKKFEREKDFGERKTKRKSSEENHTHSSSPSKSSPILPARNPSSPSSRRKLQLGKGEWNWMGENRPGSGDGSRMGLWAQNLLMAIPYIAHPIPIFLCYPHLVHFTTLFIFSLTHFLQVRNFKFLYCYFFSIFCYLYLM